MIDERTYRDAFSVDALGPGPAPSPAAVVAWTMQYRGIMPHGALALGRNGDGQTLTAITTGRPDDARAHSEALSRCRGLRGRLGRSETECRIVAVDGTVNGRLILSGQLLRWTCSGPAPCTCATARRAPRAC